MHIEKDLPSLHVLLARLVNGGADGRALAFSRTQGEITSLPVTYNCPKEEA